MLGRRCTCWLAFQLVWHLLTAPISPAASPQTPVGDLLVSFTKDQDVLDEALPDAIYYAGIYSLILIATTITVSVTIPLFSVLAAGLFIVSGIMLYLYLPAATHLKKLRMGTAGEWACGCLMGLPVPCAVPLCVLWVACAAMHAVLCSTVLFTALQCQ